MGTRKYNKFYEYFERTMGPEEQWTPKEYLAAIHELERTMGTVVGFNDEWMLQNPKQYLYDGIVIFLEGSWQLTYDLIINTLSVTEEEAHKKVTKAYSQIVRTELLDLFDYYNSDEADE